MFGKLIDGNIEYAPNYMKKDDKDIFNYNLESNSTMLITDGYKVIVDSFAPADMKEPRKVWKETDTEIIASWVDDYVEPTIEEQNEAIRQIRESLYRATSDYIKADYDEAVARGSENVEELKKAWLESKDKIRAENPYIGGNNNGLQNKEEKVEEVFELYSMEI